MIRAGWPDRKPTWLPFLEWGTVLRVTDAEPKNWLPRALRSVLTHWRYRGGTLAAAAPAPTQAAAQVTAAPGGDGPERWARGGGEGPLTRDARPAGLGPPT